MELLAIEFSGRDCRGTRLNPLPVIRQPIDRQSGGIRNDTLHKFVSRQPVFK